MPGTYMGWRMGLERLALSAAVLALMGCDLMSTRVAQGGGSEATNGNLIGAAVYGDGSNAAWSSVVLRREGYLRDTAHAEREIVPDALAGADGRWQLDSLEPGAYVLEVKDGKGRAEARPILIRAGNNLTLSDTLRQTAAVSGMLSAPPGDPGVGSAFVQLYGLEHIIQTDALGRFTLAGLPLGRHRFHAVTGHSPWAYPDLDLSLDAATDTLNLGIIPLRAFLEEDYRLWAHSRSLRLAIAPLALQDTLKETLKDFLVLIRLDAGNFDFSQSDGIDLRVADAAGRHLDCEVEEYSPAKKRASLWVRMDSLPLGGPEPRLTLYWGRPQAPELSEGRRVFRAYDGAWHLQGKPGSGISDFADASPQGLEAIGDAPAFDSAVSGLGGAFSGGQHVTIPDSPLLRPVTGLAYSIWIRARSTDSLGGDVGSMGDNYGLRVLPDGNLYFFVFNDTTWHDGQAINGDRWKHLPTSGLSLLDDRWHQIAGTFDGSSLRIYADGKEVLKANDGRPLLYPFRKDFEIGRHGLRTHDKDYQGALDEARFSRTAWSAARIRMEFENLKPGSGLVVFE